MSWISALPVQQLAMALLHFLWQGLIIGALYAVSLPLTRQAGANARYGIAVATLAILALAPVATLFYLLSGPAPVAGGGGVETVILMARHSAADAAAGPWFNWVVAGWLAGVSVLSLRLLLGWHFLLRLRRSADREAAARFEGVMDAIARRLGVARRVGLAISHRVSSPVVIGWLKPLVLLPPALLNGLPTRQMEMVLAHELAHIRRHDHLINLFQTLVETLLFYHPVVAWVSRRIRIERENACDDLAIAVTENRLSYVEMLASLERLRHRGPRLALAIHDGQILGRIRRLVEKPQPRRQRGLTIPALVLGTLLAGTAGVAWLPEPRSAADESRPAGPMPVELADAERTRLAADGDRSQPEPEARALAAPVTSPEPPVESASRSAGKEPATEPETDPSPAPATQSPPAERGTSEPEPEAVEALTPARNQALDQARTQADEQPPESNRPAVEKEPASPEPAAEVPADAAQLDPAMLLRPEQALALAGIPEPGTTSQPDRDRAGRAGEDQALPISGGELVRRITPEYPERARQRLIEGLVEVEFVVQADGTVGRVQVQSEQPRGIGFGEAATRAIRNWQFEPFRRGDEAIDRRVRMEVEFNPEDHCTQTIGTRIPRC